MAYQRKSSKHIADAQERAANLKAIDPALDLGNDLTLAAFNAEIAAAQNLLDTYNAKLAKADAAGNDFKAAEKRLRAQSARMLAGVGVKYGKAVMSTRWLAAPAPARLTIIRTRRRKRLRQAAEINSRQCGWSQAPPLWVDCSIFSLNRDCNQIVLPFIYVQ